MIENIEKEYNDLVAKFGLPSFNKLNSEFEISSIEKHDFLLRNVRRKMHEKLEFFSKAVESIIHPSGESIVSSYESDFFSDEEKNSLASLHKKLLIFERRSSLLEIGSSDENEVIFINDLFNEWDNIKSSINGVINKLITEWTNESSDNESEGKYFG